MREFVSVDTVASREVWEHLSREFGDVGSWRHCWEKHCLIPVPRPSTKFEVVEPLEICNSSNIHRGRTLPVGKYQVMEIGCSSTSHIIRIRDIDTGRELPSPIYIGYSDENQMDWRGVRKIA